MSKHTPGPWTLNDSGLPALSIYTATNVSPFHGSIPEDEQWANARLIAAAPEMLDLLQCAHACSGIVGGRAPGWLREARALIAKIEEYDI